MYSKCSIIESLKRQNKATWLLTLRSTRTKKITIHCLVTKLCLTLLQPHGLQPTRLLCPWDFPCKNMEWVAISFSRGSFWPRDWTHIYCIGRRILYHWPTREAFTICTSTQKTFVEHLLWVGHWDKHVLKQAQIKINYKQRPEMCFKTDPNAGLQGARKGKITSDGGQGQAWNHRIFK